MKLLSDKKHGEVRALDLLGSNLDILCPQMYHNGIAQ